MDFLARDTVSFSDEFWEMIDKKSFRYRPE